MSPGKGWLDWLLSEERRQARRRKSLPLVAYYWDGAQPVAHAVRDTSPVGVYLLTDHRWYPGTVLAMTLQHTGADQADPERAIAVNARVVRTGDDGVGFEFIVPEKNVDLASLPRMPAPIIDKKKLKSFMDRLSADKAGDTRGQALIEFVIVLPLLFLLILNVVNFGGFFYAWITMADAARSGANYAILGGASAGSPNQGSVAQIDAVVAADIASLPNSGGATVNICQTSYNTTTGRVVTTTLRGTCTGIATDPESTNYVLTEVQVNYTYTPFFAAFNFPKLGVNLTLPPTTITQSAAMRSIQ